MSSSSSLSEFDLAGYRYRPVDGAESKPYNVALRHAEKGCSFEWEGQEHYDALGEKVIEYLQLSLEESYGLVRRVGKDGVHVFASEDIGTADKVCVIIHGSGAVRAGMWARQLCINDTLKTGSIFEYVERAQKLGMAILVTNGNEPPQANHGGKANPTFHVQSAIREFIVEPRSGDDAGDSSSLNDVDAFIVAHSYGGVCVLSLLTSSLFSWVKSHCRAIALTDSVHTIPRGSDTNAAAELGVEFGIGFSHARDILASKAINWVTSSTELDTLVEEPGEWNGCKEISAGHNEHIHTSASCIDSVFRFFQTGDPATIGKKPEQEPEQD